MKTVENLDRIFFSDSPKMNRIRAAIKEIAKTDITILIKGETGVGKEIVARDIHLSSSRREKPFIKVNCAAIPRGLLESELFGFDRGAFTGANLRKPGKFELANGGTILLNEIGETDIATQAKLLHVLQDGTFSRLGGNGNIDINTRVITTTKDHLELAMEKGNFREDLFFRINVMSITVPPLRDRIEQIPALTQHFFDFYRTKYQRSSPPLSSDALNAFMEYQWPGNIRELENVVKRIVLLGEEKAAVQEMIDNSVKSERRTNGSIGISLNNTGEGMESLNLKKIARLASEKAEKKIIHETLHETHWNRKETAKLLRVSYKALLYKIQKYQLDNLNVTPKAGGEQHRDLDEK
jgi:two-component system, NtrC family, response regulator AtoC